MIMKKKIILSIASIAVIALLIFLLLQPKQDETINPNLMTAPKTFIYPENAETRFKKLVADHQLEKIFIKETVNTLYQGPGQKWSGRLKHSGVSHHALFTVDQSTIIFKLKKPEAGGLIFSIFNPADSRLFYTVALKSENQTVNLYKAFYDKESMVSKTIDFPRTLDGEVEFIFQTKGKGVGAWINPGLKIQKEKPKVFIVIVLDTMRYDHTSLYGYSRKTTPMLDQLSKEAVVFRNAYTTTSWTLPAHVSLFSGKNLEEHGVVTPNDRISETYPLAAEIFQQNGYVTAAFTGGGFIEDSYGFARGFQVYSNIPGSVFSKNSAQRVFNHFKNYIGKYWGNDLFIFLHTYQPHAPYKAPHEFIDRINKDIDTNMKGIKNFIRGKQEYFKAIAPEERQVLIDLYDASILYCDNMLLGNVVDFLKEKGMYEDSMLVVLSDHGEEFFDHHSWEHGHTLYNELIKIPLVIKYPKNRKKGEENALASITDIPALLLKESGLSFDETVFKNEIGRDKRTLPILLPLSPIIDQFPAKISFINENYHFILNIIDKEKMTFFKPPPTVTREIELYDSRDYLEKINIYKRKIHVLERFAEQMEKYLQKVKGIKMKKFKLDKELEQKLKSLGYLGN